MQLTTNLIHELPTLRLKSRYESMLHYYNTKMDESRNRKKKLKSVNFLTKTLNLTPIKCPFTSTIFQSMFIVILTLSKASITVEQFNVTALLIIHKIININIRKSTLSKKYQREKNYNIFFIFVNTLFFISSNNFQHRFFHR